MGPVLSFKGHIPDLHMRFEVPIVRLDTLKNRGQDHPVVDGVGGNPLVFDPIRKWCLAQVAGLRQQTQFKAPWIWRVPEAGTSGFCRWRFWEGFQRRQLWVP